MTMNVDKQGCGVPSSLHRAIGELSDAFAKFGHAIKHLNLEKVFEHTRPIISVGDAKNYWQWSAQRPKRFGSEFPARFDFWAQSGRMEGVLFIDQMGQVGIPMYRKDDSVIFHFFNLRNGQFAQRSHNVTALMPLFPKAVLQTLGRQAGEDFKQLQRVVAKTCEVRDKWLAEPRTITPAEREAISELDAAKTAWDIPAQRRRTAKERHDDEQDAIRALADSIIARQMSERQTLTGRWEDKISRRKHYVDNDVIVKGTQKVELPKEGKEDMNFKDKFVDTQKSALAQVTALQAGRASNKVIKEAMRPLVSSFFKPNFMQRIAMKVFGIQNPTDKFMASDASDMICAQLAQVIVEVRGVENENVRKVTEAGIVYAGNKLADNIPLEATIDSVVAKLVEGADSVAGKLGK